MSTRLVEASTPYLRAGAAQSIDWWPFGAAALEEARAQDRPLLVVVGAGFSFACRRLDAEAFEDDELVRAIGTGFVAVRVDCEARPDIDARLQRWAGSEARPSWPLIALLRPSGEPTVARAHLGRAGLRALLAGAATGVPLRQIAAPPIVAGTRAEQVAAALASVRAAFDAACGGFEPPPKLPRAPLLALLLELPELRGLALRTLDAMAQGGLQDQLEGGFHRVSTDERWVVPHFEKRAVDQAALLTVYARAAAVSGAARFADVARNIAVYVERRLAAPGGGFYAAEDAHRGPYDEGGYYTWTVDEARAVLDADELAVAQPTFDLYGRGEMLLDPTRNVLFCPSAPSEIARELRRDEADVRTLVERARRKLLVAREARPRPAVDPSLYVSSNAALARALIETAGPLGLDTAHAWSTLQRLYAAVRADGSVPHRLLADGAVDGSPPWLADHVELARAADAAWVATGDIAHRDMVRQIAAYVVERFAPTDGPIGDGGALPGAPSVDERASPVDGAGLSAAAGAVRLFRALAARSGDPAWARRAETIVDALLPEAAAAPVACAGLVACAVEPAPGAA